MVKYLVLVVVAFIIAFPALWVGRIVSAQQMNPPPASGTAMARAATAWAPGPERDDAMPYQQDRNLIHHEHFQYRIERAHNPTRDIVVLLHGSGGDETSLLPFAQPIWPRATLLGVRGRVVQDGEIRWYRKITPVRFDEFDVEREADALVRFLTDLAAWQQYDTTRMIFVGYSNGANLLAVMMMKHPDFVRRAVLMRSMPVLDKMPGANLHKARVLTISGKNDVLYSPFAPALSTLLRMNGAQVDSYLIDSDHMLSDEDARIVARWLASQNRDSISAMTRKKHKK